MSVLVEGEVRPPKATEESPWLEVRRGVLLRYTVAITNDSWQPFRFRHGCPVYEQWFSTFGGDVPHTRITRNVLNCGQAGELRPGEPVRFEMVLRVPADARVGTASLQWILAPTTYEHPYARARVAVRR